MFQTKVFFNVKSVFQLGMSYIFISDAYSFNRQETANLLQVREVNVKYLKVTDRRRGRGSLGYPAAPGCINIF